ncbi:MAG: hypothetical protein WAV31_02155 [Candidatus Moraniibacteriota bacterium]
MSKEDVYKPKPKVETDGKNEQAELLAACEKAYNDLLENELANKDLKGNLNGLRKNLRSDLKKMYKEVFGAESDSFKKPEDISMENLKALSEQLEDFKNSEKFKDYQDKARSKEEVKKEGVISKKEFFEKCNSLGLKKAPDDRVFDKNGDAFFVKDYSENTGIVEISIKLPGGGFEERTIESVEEFENLVKGVQDGTMTLREIFEAKPETSKNAEVIIPEVVDVVPADLKYAGIDGKEREADLMTAVEIARGLYAKKDYELTNAITGIKNTLGRFFRPNQQISQESKIYFANYKDALKDLLDHQIKELKKESLSPTELTEKMEVLAKYYNESEQMNLIEARTNAKTEAWENKYKLPNYLAKKSEKFVNGYRKLDWKLKMLASVGLLSAGVAVGIAGTAGFAGATGLASAVGVAKLMKRGLSGLMAGAGITGALEVRYRKKEGAERQKKQAEIIRNVESINNPEAKYEAMKELMQEEINGYAKGLKTEKDKARSRRLFGITAGILVGSGSYLFSHFNSAEIPTGNSVDVPLPGSHLETIGKPVDLAEHANANPDVSPENTHLEEIGKPVDLTSDANANPDVSPGSDASVDSAGSDSGLRPDKAADLARKKEFFHNLFKDASKVPSDSGFDLPPTNSTIPLYDPNFSVGNDSLEEIGKPINLTEHANVSPVNPEIPSDNHEIPVGASSEIYSEKVPELSVDLETEAGPSSTIASGDAFEKGFDTNSPVENIKGVEIVGKGDSVWKMIDRQLQGRYEGFSKLDPAIQAHIIDALKDKVANDPSSFGLENVDEINVGQEVDLSSLFEDDSDITDAFYQAESLNPEELKNITENNAKIASWRIDNPDQPLTPAKVEEIIKNTSENLKPEILSADNAVESGMDGEIGNPDIDVADSETPDSEISAPKEATPAPLDTEKNIENKPASTGNDSLNSAEGAATVAPVESDVTPAETESLEQSNSGYDNLDSKSIGILEKYDVEATSFMTKEVAFGKNLMVELSLGDPKNWDIIKNRRIWEITYESTRENGIVNAALAEKIKNIEADFVHLLGDEARIGNTEGGNINGNREDMLHWVARVTKLFSSRKVTA